MRDNRLEDIKKVSRITAHFNPPNPKINVPIKAAP